VCQEGQKPYSAQVNLQSNVTAVLGSLTSLRLTIPPVLCAGMRNMLTNIQSTQRTQVMMFVTTLPPEMRSLCKEYTNKKTQLSLTNPRDAKPCKKVLQFDVGTNYRQLNNLFEVMEIRCLVIKFLIQITSTYSS